MSKLDSLISNGRIGPSILVLRGLLIVHGIKLEGLSRT